MEHGWNEIYKGQPKYSGKNLSQYHFVHHKFHMDWLGIEPGPPRWEAGDEPTEPWHDTVCLFLVFAVQEVNGKAAMFAFSVIFLLLSCIFLLSLLFLDVYMCLTFPSR
jgi:hypothetical protein